VLARSDYSFFTLMSFCHAKYDFTRNLGGRPLENVHRDPFAWCCGNVVEAVIEAVMSLIRMAPECWFRVTDIYLPWVWHDSRGWPSEVGFFTET